MKSAPTQHNIPVRQTTTLYRFVFASSPIRYIVAIMFVFFLIQPVSNAFAFGDIPIPLSVEIQEGVTTSNIDASATDAASRVQPVTEEGVIFLEEATVANILEEVHQQTYEDVRMETQVDTTDNFIDSFETHTTPVSNAHTENILENTNEPVPSQDMASSTEVFLDKGVNQAVTSSVPIYQNSDTVMFTMDTATSGLDMTLVTSDDHTLLSSQATNTDMFKIDISSTTLQQEKPVTIIQTGTSNVPSAAKNETQPTEGQDEVLSIQDSTELSFDDLITAPTTTFATSTIATSTEVGAGQVIPMSDVSINDLNAFQFSNKECVSVGDGSYYCSEGQDAPEYAEDGVFSAPDSDGDMEIYVTIAGKTVQVTHNLADDVSPYYDGLSNTIVWHSMKNDRFQIAQYNFTTGDISYITDTLYNNMEPVAYGNIILWQAWIDNNWEIMLFDGASTTRLTNNQTHDITPQIRDGYIIWQTQFSEGWKIALYDTKTKKVQYIADSDGSDIANPRFVLVYDSKDTVGDVQTLGYDFGSGDTFTLGRLPVQLPKKLPKPDQTGETGALIQVKPVLREDKLVSGDGPLLLGNQRNASSSASSTVQAVVSNIQEGDLIVVSPTTTSATNLQADIPDVSVSTSTGVIEHSNITHIQDVVIPPFVSTFTPEVG